MIYTNSMAQIPKGWSRKNDRLYFALKCQDFKHALAILNSFGDIAERLQHHPDVGIRNYNEVFVSTTTHDKGGVTEKDYQLAEEINSLLQYQLDKAKIEIDGRRANN